MQFGFCIVADIYLDAVWFLQCGRYLSGCSLVSALWQVSDCVLQWIDRVSYGCAQAGLIMMGMTGQVLTALLPYRLSHD